MKGFKTKRTGFSIVELLTVMSIIVVLIGLLVPGLQMTRRYAKDIQQKVQFRGIANGLELYNAAMDGYPDSTAKPTWDATAGVTVGAQHLAEALAGRDLQGFDPASSFDAALDSTDGRIYGNSGNQADIDASINRRKGPYLDTDSGNIDVYNLAELYGTRYTPGSVYSPAVNTEEMPAPVLTDVFRNFRLSLETEDGSIRYVRVGSPILYFKAKPGVKVMYDPTHLVEVDPDKSVYNIYDNLELVKFGPVEVSTESVHHFDDAYTVENGFDVFYRAIQNKRITKKSWPYNANSYILMSAGWDGIFGTNDDVMNFGD